MCYIVTTAGVTGVVKSIDLRKSRILAEDGKLPVMPNKARGGHLGGGGARRA